MMVTYAWKGVFYVCETNTLTSYRYLDTWYIHIYVENVTQYTFPGITYTVRVYLTVHKKQVKYKVHILHLTYWYTRMTCYNSRIHHTSQYT